MPSAKRAGTAFTLVEMLVIIAIILVLAALLMPALQRTLETARVVSCANNQRQIALGCTQYGETYNGWMIVHYTDIGGAYWGWPFFLAGVKGVGGIPDAPIIEPGEAYSCPSNLMTKMYPFSAAHTANGNYSYGLCDSPNNFGTQQLSTVPGGVSWQRPFLNASRLKRVKRPSSTVWGGDSMKGSGWPSGTMMASVMPTGEVTRAARIHLIHTERANSLFYDGHVSLLTCEQLYQETDSRWAYFYSQEGLSIRY